MTGIILLAAGASTRLGKPKQHLPFQGQSLQRRAAKTAVASGLGPVVVVIGARAETMAASLKDLPVQTVHNPAWEAGMSSSIKAGLQHLLVQHPPLEQTLFMLCDQPFVEADILQQLVQTQIDSGKGIIVSAYENTLGTPALFTQLYFSELLALQGQEGAKKLFSRHPHDTFSLPFPSGAMDVDTQEGYVALLSLSNL